MTAYTRIVEGDRKMKGLAAYHASRPPHSEGLAVFIASYLAHETALPNINLLHLSSKKAVQAALMMAEVFPHIDFRREVTIGHLMLDINSPAAELAKVNPPIRPRSDVEYLWQALLDGELDWVVSDHACCRHETKIAKRYFGNIWMAKSGFGGTESVLSAPEFALADSGGRRRPGRRAGPGLLTRSVKRISAFAAYLFYNSATSGASSAAEGDDCQYPRSRRTRHGRLSSRSRGAQRAGTG